MSFISRLRQRFPARTLLLRTDGDVSYLTLKTWHQLGFLSLCALFLLWLVAANVAFLASFDAWKGSKAELQAVIQRNQSFVAGLESDQKHVHELRMRYEAERQKNERLLAEFESLRDASQTLLAEQAPATPMMFSEWLTARMAQRIRAVDAENAGLTAMISNLAVSVGAVTGQAPPEDVTEVPVWFSQMGKALEDSVQQQVTAMDSLQATLAEALSTHYELISDTPLADPEVSGVAWNPMHGMGGNELPLADKTSNFERFADRANQLSMLSDDLDRLNKLLACAPLASPVDYYNLTSRYGARKDPFTKKKAWHDGVDLGAWPGTKVRTTAAGIVTHAGVKGGYGRLVVIDHGCGIETLYGHLKSITVKKGQVLSHRDIIGAVGNSGRSTGPHVHYEIRIHDQAVDPYQFIEAGRYVFKAKEQTIASTQQTADER